MKIKDKAWIHYHGNNDIGKCYVCEQQINKKKFHLGHVRPKKYGGTKTLDNVYTLSEDCNWKCGTHNLEEYKLIYDELHKINFKLNNLRKNDLIYICKDKNKNTTNKIDYENLNKIEIINILKNRDFNYDLWFLTQLEKYNLKTLMKYCSINNICDKLESPNDDEYNHCSYYRSYILINSKLTDLSILRELNKINFLNI